MTNKAKAERVTETAFAFADALDSAITWTVQYEDILDMIQDAQIFARCGGSGMLIIGESGVGKSHLCSALLKLEQFQPVQKAECLTQPILYIESPDRANDTALLERLLAGLGANNPKLGTYWDKMERLQRLIVEKEVQLVFIDEAHDYLPKTNKKTNPVPKSLNIIKKLINGLRVPLILMGLPELLKIKDYRFSSIGEVELPQRFPNIYNMGLISYGIEKPDKVEFAGILDNYTTRLPVQPELLRFIDKGRATNTHVLDRFYITTKGDFRLLKQLIVQIYIYMAANKALSLADLHFIRTKRETNNPHNSDAFALGIKAIQPRLLAVLKATK